MKDVKTLRFNFDDGMAIEFEEVETDGDIKISIIGQARATILIDELAYMMDRLEKEFLQ